ncbi:multidrug transporter [Halorientalis pallida]|uniref:Multidrug transporter n=1 Tax=Halorientalis pallida TaxID=2479928 RepID=A0A498L3B9_9EURY|nr:multidrug transporter [Halorientalis pallida]RXK51821.1 multidrug transporter [Halorientalis pallida]
MPGRPAESRSLQVVGALVALVAVIGYTVYDWQWGSGDPLPTAIGLAVAALAIGVTLYRRLDLG